MGIERLGLSDKDLELLAAASDQSADVLRADLERRPWSVLDLLALPSVVEAALEPADPFRMQVSPFLFFAVLVQTTADDLRTSTVINEWTGPRQRLPMFDVEPVREFADAPGRVIFVARLLASFARPVELPVPANAFDLSDLACWLDAAMPDDRPILLGHLGDLALFRAGILADKTGARGVDQDLLLTLARQLELSDEEIEQLLDTSTFSPGIDAMESLGPAWYRAAQDSSVQAGTSTPILSDIASRFRPARRFLNHLADRYLSSENAQIGFTI